MMETNPDNITADLRPHLGHLNWQLRRIGKNVQITVGDEGVVKDAALVEADAWTVKCDGCSKSYPAGQLRYPLCPYCGTVERR